jgi:hypothetical protein
VFDTQDTALATATTFSYTIPVGGEGKTFRFRIASTNELGTGVYSDEI